MTQADPTVLAEARTRATATAHRVPRPTDDEVLEGLHAIDAAHRGRRPGGDPGRGGSATRRIRRRRMWVMWGGVRNGYVPCVYCGVRCHLAAPGDLNPDGLARFEADKLIGGPEGGTYSLENLVPACPHCNRARGRRPHPFGEPSWGDPVRNALRVAVEHGLAYDPGWAIAEPYGLIS